MIGLLREYRQYLIFAHVFGLVIGLGAATIVDILFFKFLKNYKIARSEADVMNLLSKVIWVGLIILIVTGLCLYLPNTERLNDSAKFFVKMIVVGVIIVNGTLLNLLVAPKMTEIDFSKPKTNRDRKLSFVFGAISMVSWYSAFALGMLRSLPFSFAQLLYMYLGLLCLGIISSQIFESLLVKRAGRN